MHMGFGEIKIIVKVPEILRPSVGIVAESEIMSAPKCGMIELL